MYFSRLTLRDNVSAMSLFGKVFANPYTIHQRLWQVFSDSPERRRDFLYRLEQAGKKPVIYTVSAREPNKENELWCTETKAYHPNIIKGDLLAFSLRVNPVEITKKDRLEEEMDLWKKNRMAKGLKDKVTKKRIRHDVVMSAKKKMGWKGMSFRERPYMAKVVHEAGLDWLKKRSVENGFDIDVNKARVDGYAQHYFLKGSKKIKLSTLEVNGVLKVEDSQSFLQMLYHGLGPAKGFGCGLMLVKRA